MRILNTEVIDIVFGVCAMALPMAVMFSWVEITECSKKLDGLIRAEIFKVKKLGALKGTINDEEDNANVT